MAEGASSRGRYLKQRLSLVLPSWTLQRPPAAPCDHSPCDVGIVFCLFGCHSPGPLVRWWPTVHGISLLRSLTESSLMSPREAALSCAASPVLSCSPGSLNSQSTFCTPGLCEHRVGSSGASMEGPWSGSRGGGHPSTLLEKEVGTWPLCPAKNSLHSASPPLLTLHRPLCILN